MMSLSKLLKGQPSQTVDGEAAVIPVSSLELDQNRIESPPEDLASAEERLHEVKVECERLLEEARQRCTSMLDAAKARAGEIEREAYDAGYKAGLQDGILRGEQQGRAEWETRIAEIADLMREANEARKTLIRSTSHVLVQVAMETVRQLLNRELNVEPFDIEGVVSELLQYVTDSMSVEVRVHPDDFVRATEAHPRWKSAKFGEWEVVIVPDTDISPGGCEIRSEHGRVDARLETKLELLERMLTEVMERSVNVHVNELGSGL
jgi:flagellar assembly protein FliH